MNKSIQILENRVGRLERSNRLLMICCAAFASVPVLMGAMGQGGGKPAVQLPPGQLAPLAPLPASAQKYLSKQIQDMLAADRQIHNVLRTRVLALVDKDGKTKAYLSTDEKGDPMLTMFGVRDMRGTTGVSLSLGLNANNPEFVFFGYDDKPRAGLYSMGEGRDRSPTLMFAPSGQILMKHANGNALMRLMTYGEITQFEANDKDGKNAAVLRSGGAQSNEFLLTASQSRNTIRLFAGPSFVSISANSTGTKYSASMSAEGTQATVRGRGKNGPMDQVFSSKWRSPLHDIHSWQIKPEDPF